MNVISEDCPDRENKLKGHIIDFLSKEKNYLNKKSSLKNVDLNTCVNPMQTIYKRFKLKMVRIEYIGKGDDLLAWEGLVLKGNFIQSINS